MTATTIAAVMLILGVSSAIQATLGFAFALFAIPLLNLVGMPVIDAIATSTTAMLAQMVFGVIRLRGEVVVRPLLLPLTLATASLGLGVVLLKLVAGIDPGLLSMLVGGALLVVVALYGLVRPPPREQVATGWTVVAAVTSGLLNGLTGMGGPPIAIWAVAHDWSVNRIRTTIWALIIPRVPIQLFMLYLAFGAIVGRSILIGLAAIPVVYAGSLVGLRLGGALPVERLRTIALVVLALIAARALLGPLLS